MWVVIEFLTVCAISMLILFYSVPKTLNAYSNFKNTNSALTAVLGFGSANASVNEGFIVTDDGKMRLPIDDVENGTKYYVGKFHDIKKLGIEFDNSFLYYKMSDSGYASSDIASASHFAKLCSD